MANDDYQCMCGHDIGEHKGGEGVCAYYSLCECLAFEQNDGEYDDEIEELNDGLRESEDEISRKGYVNKPPPTVL